jgi:hypothetical protein
MQKTFNFGLILGLTLGEILNRLILNDISWTGYSSFLCKIKSFIF